MDISNFTPDAPGQIVKIDGDEHAFVPARLPPDWEFPAELWPLLGEAKQQMGILEGLGRTLPNPAILLRPLEDREAIRSSRLEGTYATPKELLLFEIEPRESESEDEPANDWKEVFNYRLALQFGTTTDLPLSLRLIRQFHKMLVTGVRGKERSPGEFRKMQVAIGSTLRFVPPPPQRLMECLDPMEKYLHVSEDRFDPLVQCFLVHYQFETIHPFIDGNGRVGRMLLAVMFQRLCVLSKPWLYMSEFFERYRDEYVQHMFNVSAKGNWHAWIEFCLRGTVSQARDAIERCEKLRAIQQEFAQRLKDVGGSVRLNTIVERVFESPFVRVKDLPQRLGVTYPTAKRDVERLVEAGILEQLEGMKPKIFYAPEVYNVAYDDV